MGNINRDNNPDLVIALADNRVAVLLNNTLPGASSLTIAAPVYLTTPARLRDVAIGNPAIALSCVARVLGLS